VLSASYQFGERLLPFLRYGNSDGGAGGAAKQSLRFGGEYTLTETQAVSLGFAWNEANKRALDNSDIHEYLLEASYRIQLSPNFSLTPDLQWLKNPANLEETDSNWAFALRAILTI